MLGTNFGACAVRLPELQLGGVLDRHDPLGVRDGVGEDIQERGLASPGAAGDEDIQARLHRRAQDLGEGRRDRAELDEVAHPVGVRRETPDRQKDVPD